MTTLHELEQHNPEWRPWLQGMQKMLAELGDPAWDPQVPPLPSPAGVTPLVAAAGLDPAATPLALLHACRRRWADAVPRDWGLGYCPLCGAWPGFAELCGVERTRYLRCVRCGAAWRAHGLSCAFCGNADHKALGSLVAADAGPSKWTIEVCHRCRGYLKAFTRLTVGEPAQAMLDDLGSVELDLVAQERGFHRPPGTGHGSGVAA